MSEHRRGPSRVALRTAFLAVAALSACQVTPSGEGARDAWIGVDHRIVDEYVPGCRSIVENPFVVRAATCARADVAQAVAEAAAQGGGTVCLPRCLSEWWEEEIALPGGVGLIGEGMGETVLRSRAYRFFSINEPGNQPGAFRISGITFEGYHAPSDSTVQNVIHFNNVQGFRIDHCHLIGCRYCISAGSRLEYPPSTGVVDHNIIERGPSSYVSVYCVSVGPREWREDMGLGTGDAVFIEDNVLDRCGHPAATFGGGHYVFRYNTVVNSDSLDGHGPGFEATGRGTRAVEVYGNTFLHDVDPAEGNQGRGWTAIGLRSGGGVIYDNTFEYYQYGVRVTIDTGVAGRTRGPACAGCEGGECFEPGDVCTLGDPGCYRYDAGANACEGCEGCYPLSEPYAYPALDQVHDLFIWDNRYDDVSNGDEVMRYANGAELLIQEDRDYFRRAPDETRDGFTYVPYPYPHPLVGELPR